LKARHRREEEGEAFVAEENRGVVGGDGGEGEEEEEVRRMVAHRLPVCQMTWILSATLRVRTTESGSDVYSNNIQVLICLQVNLGLLPVHWREEVGGTLPIPQTMTLPQEDVVVSPEG
jgi:predicted nucleic acid-binding Zn ribbon protein